MAMNNVSRRKIAERIFKSGVDSVMPERLIADAVSMQGNVLQVKENEYSLRPEQKVHVYGSGKGSVGMAKSLLTILEDRVAGGGIVTNNLTDDDLSPLTALQGSHPVPDSRSVEGAELIFNGLSGLDNDDFFFYLLSGGSSALLEKPLQNIRLEEMQETTKLLLANNVPIQQVNAVRKHLSMVKGGRLAQCTRARGVVLVISDVIGDDLSVIGSGPLYQDPSTFQECEEILRRAGIWKKLPDSVRSVIEDGVSGSISETPKKQDGAIEHYLIGTNRLALEAAQKEARKSGLNSYIFTAELSGEAKEVAKVLVAMGRNIQTRHEPFAPPCCLLFGGETTVTVHGNGKGGRNQEMVLAALDAMHPDDTMLFLSGGTDGIDGNSTAAGAFADEVMLQQARKEGILISQYLDENNSNRFFAQTGGLLETGSTGTNVMDISMLIIDEGGT